MKEKKKLRKATIRRRRYIYIGKIRGKGRGTISRERMYVN